MITATPNELQKVFYHRFSDDKTVQNKQGTEFSHIELAKLVLYFSADPILKKQDYKKGASQELQEVSFFIPQAAINSEQVKQQIAVVNGLSHAQYHASVRAVPSPVGIEIKIAYDPKKVFFKYDFFDAIKGEKGLEFHLYNKQLLEALKQKGTTILRTAHLVNPTVIIDCGHGGHDMGAIGFKAIEKEITLAIGMQLAQELKKNGLPILLTRIDDRFIALDKRTFIANQCDTQAILISLHANSAPRKEVHGLETFCLASNLFRKNDPQLQTSIDVMINQYDSWQYDSSKKLAHAVHNAVLRSINENGFHIPDRKIRQKATQMLMGIKWPGILLEMEYVTNAGAAQSLKDPRYQQAMVQGICAGIKEYLKVA